MQLTRPLPRHTVGPKQGGISLKRARQLCPANLADAAFAAPAINWHRVHDHVKDFQSVSLVQVLRHVMSEEMGPSLLRTIRIPGCLFDVRQRVRPVGPEFKYHFYVSPHNPNAAALVEEVTKYLDGSNDRDACNLNEAKRRKKFGRTWANLNAIGSSSRGRLPVGGWEAASPPASPPAPPPASPPASPPEGLPNAPRSLSSRLQHHLSSRLASFPGQKTLTRDWKRSERGVQLKTTDAPDRMLEAERFLLYLDQRTWQHEEMVGRGRLRRHHLEEELTRAISAGMQVRPCQRGRLGAIGSWAHTWLARSLL